MLREACKSPPQSLPSSAFHSSLCLFLCHTFPWGMQGLWLEKRWGSWHKHRCARFLPSPLSHVMISSARHLPGGKNTHSKWSALKWPPGFRLKGFSFFLSFFFLIACTNTPFSSLFIIHWLRLTQWCLPGTTCLHFASHSNDGSWLWKTVHRGSPTSFSDDQNLAL